MLTVTDLPEISEITFCYCYYYGYFLGITTMQFSVSSTTNSCLKITLLMVYSALMQHQFTRSLINADEKNFL